MRSLLTVICITVFMASNGCGASSTKEGPAANAKSQTAENAQEQAAKTETPREGAAAILMLLKNEDYRTLVQERYSEWERTRGMPEAESPEQMLEKMSSRLARHRDRMIDVYEQLAEAEFTIQENERPQPGETDRMAIAEFMYNDKEVKARLYLMESGRWGFHL